MEFESLTCLFCYKPFFAAVDSEGSQEDLLKFLKLLQKEVDRQSGRDKDLEVSRLFQKLGRASGACEECSQTQANYVELICQARCLELKAAFELYKLTEAMETADKLEELWRYAPEGEDGGTEGSGSLGGELKEARKQLMELCLRQQKSPYPRIVLKRGLKDEGPPVLHPEGEPFRRGTTAVANGVMKEVAGPQGVVIGYRRGSIQTKTSPILSPTIGKYARRPTSSMPSTHFKCQICSKSFFKSFHAIRHIVTNHRHELFLPFKPKSTPTSKFTSALDRLFKQSIAEGDKKSTKRFSCMICSFGSLYKDKLSVAIHLSSIHFQHIVQTLCDSTSPPKKGRRKRKEQWLPGRLRWPMEEYLPASTSSWELPPLIDYYGGVELKPLKLKPSKPPPGYYRLHHRCAHCCIKFRTKIALERHYSRRHPQQLLKRYRIPSTSPEEFCVATSRVFQLHTSLRRNRAVCKLCLRGFFHVEDLEVHIAREHLDQLVLDLVNCQTSMTAIPMTGEKPIKIKVEQGGGRLPFCDGCSKLFNSKTEMGAHSCVFRKQFTCGHCETEFESYSKFQIHLLASHRFETLSKYFKQSKSLTPETLESTFPQAVDRCISLASSDEEVSRCRICCSCFTLNQTPRLIQHVLLAHLGAVVDNLKDLLSSSQSSGETLKAKRQKLGTDVPMIICAWSLA